MVPDEWGNVVPLQIYKLSDEVPVGRGQRGEVGRSNSGGVPDERGDEGGACELKITDIKQAVRNENRVNIYVNGKYSFSLDISQVVELKVKVGRELRKEEYEELKQASEFGKMYQRALEWVLMRPRSKRELRDYLLRRSKKRAVMADNPYRKTSDSDLSDGRVSKKHEISTEMSLKLSEMVTKRLMERGYVDDVKFARYYVENRFVKKGASERRLRQELMQKGVAREIIDEVLEGSERNERDEIRKMILRKRARYDDEKLIAYLCRQGFSYELAKEMVKEENGTEI